MELFLVLKLLDLDLLRVNLAERVLKDLLQGFSLLPQLLIVDLLQLQLILVDSVLHVIQLLLSLEHSLALLLGVFLVRADLLVLEDVVSHLSEEVVHLHELRVVFLVLHLSLQSVNVLFELLDFVLQRGDFFALFRV